MLSVGHQQQDCDELLAPHRCGRAGLRNATLDLQRACGYGPPGKSLCQLACKVSSTFFAPVSRSLASLPARPPRSLCASMPHTAPGTIQGAAAGGAQAPANGSLAPCRTPRACAAAARAGSADPLLHAKQAHVFSAPADACARYQAKLGLPSFLHSLPTNSPRRSRRSDDVEARRAIGVEDATAAFAQKPPRRRRAPPAMPAADVTPANASNGHKKVPKPLEDRVGGHHKGGTLRAGTKQHGHKAPRFRRPQVRVEGQN